MRRKQLTSIYLESAQLEAVRESAKLRGVSVAEIIRRAIDRELAGADKAALDRVTRALAQSLAPWQIVRLAELVTQEGKQ